MLPLFSWCSFFAHGTQNIEVRLHAPVEWIRWCNVMRSESQLSQCFYSLSIQLHFVWFHSSKAYLYEVKFRKIYFFYYLSDWCGARCCRHVAVVGSSVWQEVVLQFVNLRKILFVVIFHLGSNCCRLKEMCQMPDQGKNWLMCLLLEYYWSSFLCFFSWSRVLAVL